MPIKYPPNSRFLPSNRKLKSTSYSRRQQIWNLNKRNAILYVIPGFLFLLILLSSVLFQGGSIQNIDTLHCLELVASKQSESTFHLAIQDCTDQKWTITNILTLLPQ